MNVLTEVSGPPLTEGVSERWIFDRLEDWARRHPDRLAFAVDHSDRLEEYRYADVLKFAERVASMLHSQGIARGDRVGILMENVPQWVFALLGAMRLGAVTVPLATTLPERSIRNVAEHAGCRLIFADKPNFEKAESVAQGMGAHVIAFDALESSPTGPPPPYPVGNSDETALLIYTSGTTGNPKGVQLSVRNLICEIQGVIEAIAMSPDHRILSVLPFSHVLPLIANGLGPVCVGAAVVFLSSISPQRITEAFHKHRITCFICVPQFFYLLHKRIFSEIEAQPFLLKRVFGLMFQLAKRIRSQGFRRKLFARIHRSVGPDLWLFASGGSRFDERVAGDLSVLGYTVLQAYGLTETSAAATATFVRDNAIGTVGKPLRGVSLRIDSPNDRGIGEVWIRGPILMTGYYREPEKTREVMSNGWLRSGDLGYIRSDGNLLITGRSKDVIVLASGKNIYPDELEMHYSQTPYVKELCVLGLPEGSGGPAGETLHAVVVPDMDEFRRQAQTSIAETIRFELENLSKQLPSYQRILSLSIRNEALPRTVTRKLKRFEILDEETTRRRSSDNGARSAPAEENPRFREGVGAIVAELVRDAKPETGSLDLSTNLELDLGFDSLARVELLGLIEARTGVHISEEEASQIFTLGDLLDALARSREATAIRGRNWKEILDVPPTDELNQHPVFKRWPITDLAAYLMIKTYGLLCRIFFRLKYDGLEKLPRTSPYLICPNHESFLDGPTLISLLPRSVCEDILILGYSDYWENTVTRWIAKFCNIVSIDPNANLVRAMQVGAVGLKRNRVLLIFPEGTRSIDGHLAGFKKGSAILACELGVPIVPVGIRGTFEAWPRAGGFRFHPIEIVFGDPIDPKPFASFPDPYAALTEKLRNDVKVLADDV